MPNIITARKGFRALSPFVVFLVLYLGGSLWQGDFYAMPVAIPFLVASVVGVCLLRGGVQERVDVFSRGAATTDVMMMLWMFVLAGAFAASAKSIGAIDATVNLCLAVVPAQWLLVGVFVSACFISLSIGTSVGTVVALTPIAAGLARETGESLPMMVGAVVGGVYFGDNLSFISDTTIIATRSQGCEMKDKFRTNLWIALPAAAVVILLYCLLTSQSPNHITPQSPDIDWILVAPYLLVLATALCGMHVLAVLTLGLVSTLAIASASQSDGLLTWLSSAGSGVVDMGELIIVSLLASGLVGVTRELGGFEFVIQRLTKNISSPRGAKLSIAALTVVTDVCTANNTIALLTVSPLAREISERYHISPKRTASILDTFSNFSQALLPYGAQMLIAAKLSETTPFEILPCLYYPMALGVISLATILKKGWK